MYDTVSLTHNVSPVLHQRAQPFVGWALHAQSTQRACTPRLDAPSQSAMKALGRVLEEDSEPCCTMCWHLRFAACSVAVCCQQLIEAAVEAPALTVSEVYNCLEVNAFAKGRLLKLLHAQSHTQAQFRQSRVA